jgi:hypothetical protein
MRCYFGLEKLKKESTVGDCDDEPNINEKKIPFSTRTPEEIIIKFRCIRIVAKKAIICFVMAACQCARPRETAHFPVDSFCDILYRGADKSLPRTTYFPMYFVLRLKYFF